MTLFQDVNSKSQAISKGDSTTTKKYIIYTSNASEDMSKKYHNTKICLGQGSYGKVYLFKDLEKDSTKTYAVKIILKNLIP